MHDIPKPSRFAALVAVVVSALAPPACDVAPPDPVAPEPLITDSAGVRTVVSYAPRWRSGEEWTISAEPILRIGTVDSAAEYAFHEIRGVTRLSDSTIVVLNSGDATVRYYAPDGTHIRSVGSAGRGPGEMRGPRWLERMADDVVQITHSDGRLRYARDGTLFQDDRLDWGRIHALSRVVAFPGTSAFLMEACGLPTPLFLADDVLLCATSYSDVRFLPQTEGLHLSVSYVGVSDWSLEEFDTIGAFAQSAMIRYRATGRLHSARFGPPYGPRGRMRVTGWPPRLAYTDTRAYRIESHAIGAPRRRLVIERRGGLRAPTELELRSFDRGFELEDIPIGSLRSRETAERFRRPAGDPDEFRDLVTPVDSVSIISNAPYIDALNAMWVPLETEPVVLRPYDVFDENGVYLGQIDLPRALAIHEIGEDYILGVTRDELSVEYVAMYRIDRTR